MDVVVVTGSASGMGNIVAKKFIHHGYEVHGIDVLRPDADLAENENYHHHICDITEKESLPDIDNVSKLINSAGLQNSGNDIEVNLKGLMNCTEKYALNNEHIRAVVNQASASASTGADFGEYVASKGGVVSYTKWVAKEIAKYGATCNSLSFGGVFTDTNNIVIEDKVLWKRIMDQTPLKQWTTLPEVAEWVFFISTYNTSCSGQDIIIDNLESLNGEFIWE